MMGRFGALVLGGALATSCATEPTQTGEAVQALADCNAGDNFKTAKMIAQPAWNGAQPPIPGTNQRYVVWMDASQTYWNVLLADPVKGRITYAAKVSTQSIGDFLYLAGAYGRIDIGHNPPPPGPTGGDWLARYALEYELRAQQLHDWAMTASQ